MSLAGSPKRTLQLIWMEDYRCNINVMVKQLENGYKDTALEIAGKSGYCMSLMLNTSVICLLKWLSDKFLTIPLNIPANPCGHLPTVSSALPRWAGWAICSKCQEILEHLLTKPGQSTKNTDKFLANFAEKFQIICQEYSGKFLAICREILDHMPINPGPYAEKPWTICRECQQILSHLPRLPRTICRECQQILGHLPRLPRTATKICLPRMPSLPWLPAHSAA